MRILIVYFLLGAILSTLMYMTSRCRLPLGREIRAHVVIALFWPFVLINIVQLMRRMGRGEAEASDLESDDRP